MIQTLNYLNENLINPCSEALTDFIVDTVETHYPSDFREKVDKEISHFIYENLISHASRSACRLPVIHLLDKAIIGYCRRYCVIHFLGEVSDHYSYKSKCWNFISSFFRSQDSSNHLKAILRPLVNKVVLVDSYSILSRVAVSIAALISSEFAWGVSTACGGLACYYYCKQIHPEMMRYANEYDRLERYVQYFAKNHPQL